MGLDIFWTLILLTANGFFVAAEFAIVKVRSSHIELQAKTGKRSALVAKHIIENLNGYLLATQMGIAFSSLALGWVGMNVITDIVTTMLGGLHLNMESTGVIVTSYVLAFALIVTLYFVFTLLIPKSIAIQRPVSTTLNLAVPLRVFYYIFGPFIWVLNGVSKSLLRLFGLGSKLGAADNSSEELQYLLEQGRENGAINTSEHDLIKNVFDFNDRMVKNIMVPRNKISAVEMNCPIDEFLAKITEEGYSRVPVYDNNIDEIIGVIHTKDVLPVIAKGQELVLTPLIRNPYFIPETKKINDLMAEFQQKRIQIAIVLDEFGATAGMVTLEDIVEELVGDIQDEYDEEVPVVEVLSETEFMVDATATIIDINEHLPIELPESTDYDTLAGLVSELFDKIPDVGEHKTFESYNFTIIKKTQQNIEFIKLELLGEDAVQTGD